MISLAASAPRTSKITRLLQDLWPERLASLFALTGVLISILLGFHVQHWQQSASDFKTMYASASLLVHGHNAYSFSGIAAVFDRNSVVHPTSWYGHAPVYPPFTLALLAPFAALSMTLAAYVWVALSAVIFAFALASLTRFAKDCFGLTRPWRLLLIAAAAASPLLSFAIEMGNVSVVVSALCLLAVSAPEDASLWFRAGGLALALLLKPHLALWVALALLFMDHPGCRRLALRAFAIAAAVCTVLFAWMTMHHTLRVQVGGYLAMIHTEVASGSMGAQRHDLVAVAAQITSLDSLTGYWSYRLHLLDVVLLIAAFAALVAASLRIRHPGPSLRLVLVAGWSGFGLLATYHRAHDGTILLVLLPWLIATLRDSWRDPRPWVVLTLGIAMSIGPTWEFWQRLQAKPILGPFASLMLYRQANVAALLLTCILFGTMMYAAFAQPATESRRARRLRFLPI